MSESHSKKHIAWEKLLEQKPELGRVLHSMASLCRDLTPAELRVCVLLRDMKTSVEIAQVLDVEERSIETYRSRIHRKLGLEPHTHLLGYLLALKL